MEKKSRAARSMPKTDKVQIVLKVRAEVKAILKQLARERSADSKREITMTQIVVEGWMASDREARRRIIDATKKL